MNKQKPVSAAGQHQVIDIARYSHPNSQSDELVSELLTKSNILQLEGTLFLDFKDVVLINPMLLLNFPLRLKDKVQKLRKGLIKGRHIVAVDPNDGVKKLLELLSREIRWSLIIVYTNDRNPRNIIRQEVLNLPEFLKHALHTIHIKKTVTSSELEELMSHEHKTRARECLRLLYKRGLVTRKPSSTPDGKTFFVYSEFREKTIAQ